MVDWKGKVAAVTDGAPMTTSGAPRRIGVFGGTFDPPHVGHLVAASWVRQALNLDHVLFMVAGDPWQKSVAGPVTHAEHRLAMVELLVADCEGLAVSDLEIRRSGPSYMVDTRGELASPDTELFLIIGADAAAGLSSWERHDELARLARIVVVDRRGVDGSGGTDGPVRRVEIPRLDISSSEIRHRLANGLGAEGLVPEPVLSYLLRHDLYRGRL